MSYNLDEITMNLGFLVGRMESKREDLSSEYQKRRELRRRAAQKVQRSPRFDLMRVLAGIVPLLATLIRLLLSLLGMLANLITRKERKNLYGVQSGQTLFQPSIGKQGLNFRRPRFQSFIQGGFGGSSFASLAGGVLASVLAALVTLIVRFKYFVLAGLVVCAAFISWNYLWGGVDVSEDKLFDQVVTDKIPHTGLYEDPNTHALYLYKDGALVEGDFDYQGSHYFFDPDKGGAMLKGSWRTVSQESEASLRGDHRIDSLEYYDNDGRRIQGEAELFGQKVNLLDEAGNIDYALRGRLYAAQIPQQEKLEAFGGFKLDDKDKKTIEQDIAKLNDKNYDVGFILLDLNTGEGLSYNPDLELYSASIAKAPYLAALDQNELKSNPQLKEKLKDKISNILHYSDDDAYKSLVKEFGTKSLVKWTDDIKLSSPPKLGERFWYTSPRDFISIWLKLYADYKAGRLDQEFVDMATSPKRSALYPATQDRERSWTKAGWHVDKSGTKVTHDTGIIDAPTGPYIAIVFSSIPQTFDELIPLSQDLCSIFEAELQKQQ